MSERPDTCDLLGWRDFLPSVMELRAEPALREADDGQDTD